MNFRNHVLAGRRTAAQSCLRLAFYIFLAVGLLAAGYAGYIIADAKAYQAIQLRKFAHHAPIVEPHVPVLGETIGQIQIPSVGLNAIILQGASAKILRRGVRHLPNTRMPGELGNVGLAGHRDSFFRPLRQIRSGDMITLGTLNGEFQYRVESTRIVSPSNIEVLAPTNKRELTLVTCFPFNYVGRAPHRFVVRAMQVEEGRNAAT